MAQYKIAHIREQGQDIIIIPLGSDFGNKPSSTQEGIIESLQLCARSAGLAGTVVPVWRVGSRHSFIAPTPWHPYFKSLSWNAIMSNLNKVLTCG
ncbi:hypothetical protein [Bordetella genomosp. 4]|uniref:Uncharacterized protein n=1 Tax=Bordetella genomosp. 4 TaxID=463044 RepID=A0A261U7Q1_9BORD|nr:hypothetical protein [Bordetella genomosp. 4]OZI57655.1 hypothetical protein CAL20_09775 [Bordetella genomosp. 4]